MFPLAPAPAPTPGPQYLLALHDTMCVSAPVPLAAYLETGAHRFLGSGESPLPAPLLKDAAPYAGAGAEEGGWWPEGIVEAGPRGALQGLWDLRRIPIHVCARVSQPFRGSWTRPGAIRRISVPESFAQTCSLSLNSHELGRVPYPCTQPLSFFVYKRRHRSW